MTFNPNSQYIIDNPNPEPTPSRTVQTGPEWNNFNRSPEPKNNTKLVYAILGVILLITLIAGLTFALVSGSKVEKANQTDPVQDNMANNQNEPISTIPPIPSELKAATSKWEKGKVYDLRVEIDNSVNQPAFTSVQISFDPSILQVEKIEKGNLWESENVLLNKIDNETGLARYDAGQGFGSKSTGQKTAAVIKFKVISDTNDQTLIKLTEKSNIASLGIDQLIYLTNNPYQISVNN